MRAGAGLVELAEGRARDKNILCGLLNVDSRQERSQDFSKGGGLKLWKQKPCKGKIACD